MPSHAYAALAARGAATTAVQWAYRRPMRLPLASASGFVNTIRSPAEADGSPLAFDSGAWSTKANVEPLLSSLNVRVVELCADAAEPTKAQPVAARATKPSIRDRVTRGEARNMRYLLVGDSLPQPPSKASQ